MVQVQAAPKTRGRNHWFILGHHHLRPDNGPLTEPPSRHPVSPIPSTRFKGQPSHRLTAQTAQREREEDKATQSTHATLALTQLTQLTQATRQSPDQPGALATCAHFHTLPYLTYFLPCSTKHSDAHSILPHTSSTAQQNQQTRLRTEHQAQGP